MSTWPSSRKRPLFKFAQGKRSFDRLDPCVPLLPFHFSFLITVPDFRQAVRYRKRIIINQARFTSSSGVQFVQQTKCAQEKKSESRPRTGKGVEGSID